MEDIDPRRGPRFDHPDHTIQAAIEGVGVVLGLRHLAQDDLATGRLVESFKLTLPLNLGFYLVYPKADIISPKLAKFRNWLVKETQKKSTLP